MMLPCANGNVLVAHASLTHTQHTLNNYPNSVTDTHKYMFTLLAARLQLSCAPLSERICTQLYNCEGSTFDDARSCTYLQTPR
jgi:hypothetical protein